MKACVFIFWGLIGWVFAQPEYEFPQNYRVKIEFENPLESLKFQSSTSNSHQELRFSKVPIEKIYSDKLLNLIELHKNLNQKQKEQDGYRIQIVSTMDQNVIKKARMEFSELNTNLKIYQVYDRPYYKLRIGDFSTKFEAEQMVYVLLQRFPAAFVVPDKIKIE